MLTDAQKKSLYRDNFIVIRGVVAPDQVAKAQALIREHLPRDERKLLVPPPWPPHPT